MPTSSAAPLFLGARRIGAFQAELTALFRALCWCLQLPDHFHLEIVSDCMSAIGIATGTQGGTSEDPLVARCRSAMHLLQALKYPQDIVVRHTRSHVGDPGNEVADALAKRVCRRGGAVDAAILPDIARTAARGSFAWLWLLVEAIRRPEAWPTFQYQALWDGPSPPPETPAPDECASFFGLGSHPDCTQGGQAQATICACLLTVNVQTLYPQDLLGPSSEEHASLGISFRPRVSPSRLSKRHGRGRVKHSSLPLIFVTPVKSTQTARVELNYGSQGNTLSSTMSTTSQCFFSRTTSLPSTGTRGFLRYDTAELPSAYCLYVSMRLTMHPVQGTLGGLIYLGSYSGLPKVHTSYCLGTLISTLKGRTTRQ